MNNSIVRLTAVAALSLSLSTFASANELAYNTTNHINSYKTVALENPVVTSDVKDAESLSDNQELGAFYARTIANALASVNKEVVPADANNAHALNIQYKVDINYGALKDLQGFAAGKGYATIVLTARDNITGEQKYQDVKTLELSQGVFGGNFDQMFKSEISQQVQKFENEIKA